MKKLLVTILIIAFVAGNLGVLFTSSDAFAQGPLGPDFVNQEAIATAGQPPPKEDSANCEGALGNFRSSCIAEKLSNFSLGLSSWVLYFAGTLFDYTIQKTVVEMKELMKDVKVVDIGWRVFRDFANIFFIFILLYISISIILGLGIDTKSILIRVILVALLINFSLFITKIVIDTSNVVAVGFYDAILKETDKLSGSDGLSVPTNNLPLKSNASRISQAFVDALNLTTIYNTERIAEDGTIKRIPIATGDIVLIGIFGSLFMLVVAFVFFAGAILFALRFIVFIFLMVLAPLAFFGMILPKTRPHASKWWGSLLNQAYFAPIYMALTFVVIKGMADFKIVGGGSGVATSTSATFAAAFGATNNASNLGIVLNFIIFIGLAIGSLIIAKSLGVSGAETTMKIGKGLQKWGQGVVGRNTVGKPLDLLSRGLDKTKERMQESTEGRVALRTLKYGSLGLLPGIKGGIEAGASAKFGSKQSARDVRERDEKDIEKGIKSRRGEPERLANYMTGLSHRDQEHAFDKMSARDRAALGEHLSDDNRQRLINTLSIEEQEKTEEAAGKALTAARNRGIKNAIKDLSSTGTTGVVVPGSSPSRVYTLDEAMANLPTNQARKLKHEQRIDPQVIRRLSPGHLADLMMEGLSDIEKREIVREITRLAPADPRARAQLDYMESDNVRGLWGV